MPNRAAGFDYLFLFDKSKLNNPKLLPNQLQREILYSVQSFPLAVFLTAIVFVFEVRGYSRLYDNVDDYGWGYLAFSLVFFLLFTGMGPSAFASLCLLLLPSFMRVVACLMC